MIITSEEGHILTHLGLGDQVTCNGLVRELYKKHPKLYVYSKLKYFYTIEFMYRDLINLTVLPMEEKGAFLFTSFHKIKNFYNIGFNPSQHDLSKITVEKSFYQQAGIDFNKKWESFYVVRDKDREKTLFNYFNVIPGEYAFFHDDIARNQIIKPQNMLNKNLKIIRVNPEISDNIFDYCSLIEQAGEIHVIESCIMFMIDLVFQNILSSATNLFMHRYTKPIQSWEYPTNKLNWNILC